MLIHYIFWWITNIYINNKLKKVKNKASTTIMKTQIPSSQESLKKYQTIKQSLQLPLKLNLYFNFLQPTLQQSQPIRHSQQFHGFSSLFYPIFTQLSRQEKAYYLYCNIEFVKLQFDKIQTLSLGRQLRGEGGNDIKATGQIGETLLGVGYWTKVEISFSYQARKIKIITKKRAFQIDLRLYLIRKSKKYENTLVLEAISEVVSVGDRKISMFFKAAIFQQVYLEIFKCILSFRNQELYKIALEDYKLNEGSNRAEISFIGTNSRSLHFLTSKNVNQFLNFKDIVLKKILKADFKFEKVYTIEACKIEKDKSNNNSDHSLYKLQTNFNCNVELLKKTFLEKYKSQDYKYLMQSQELQKCSNKYSAVYQKLLFNSSFSSFKTVEQIVIEELNLKELTCQNQQLVFKRGVKGIKLSNFLQFLMVKVKSLGTQDKSKLIVVGSFSKNMDDATFQQKKKKQTIETEETQEIIIKYLLEFSDMIFRKENQADNMERILEGLRGKSQILVQEEKENEGFDNQFMTVVGKFNHDDRDQMVMDVDQDVENQNDYSNVSVYEDPNLIPPEITHLNHSYQLQPSPLLTTQKKIRPAHFIFEQWSRRSKGGITCKDQAAINEQKQVANFLLKSIGKRIFEQKGINLSLPVTIFRPESHLHSIARNLSFAPIILQKAVKMDPVERMKAILLYALSVTVSSISVNKPFNPILGETLQMWIDGCPVYLEQISHHPPIVSYYMLGRGYKLYGSIGSKIRFGFNSISGYAEEPNFVEFDDGTRIQLNFGRMLISGIIVGERSFTFTDKMYAIDPKNKIFSQLKFGEDKTSLFSISSQPEDYFSGKIVRVNDEFINEFYKNSTVTYPVQQQVQEQISKFEGIWNGKVSIDGKDYIDFGITNGCVIEEQKYPLPSNSSYRKDIQYLKQGLVNASQNQKQIIENIQRRDAELRKIHCNN